MFLWNLPLQSRGHRLFAFVLIIAAFYCITHSIFLFNSHLNVCGFLCYSSILHHGCEPPLTLCSLLFASVLLWPSWFPSNTVHIFKFIVHCTASDPCDLYISRISHSIFSIIAWPAPAIGRAERYAMILHRYFPQKKTSERDALYVVFLFSRCTVHTLEYIDFEFGSISILYPPWYCIT